MRTIDQHRVFAQRLGLVGLTRICLAFSSLLILPILTKSLTVADYGVWVQMHVMITLVPTVVVLGLPFTMVRFLPSADSREKIQEGFYSLILIVAFLGGAVGVFFYAFAPAISAALFNGDVPIVRILALIIFIESLNLLAITYFRTFQQIKRYSVIMLFRTYLSFAVVAALILLGFGILGAAWGLLAEASISLVIIMGLIVREIGICKPRFTNVREYLGFGLPTVPGNLSDWIVTSSDRVLIGLLLGSTFVGYYTPGYTLGNTIGMLIAPLAFLLPPVLSKYYDENNIVEVRRVLGFSLKYFLALAIPAFFGLSCLSRPLLTILTTPEIADQSYVITPYVALSLLLFGIFSLLGGIIVLEKRTTVMGTTWTLAAFTNVVLNYLFIPWLGIVGAAMTTLAAYILGLALTIHYTKHSLRRLEFPVDTRFIAKSIFASVLFSVLLLAWNPVGMVNVLIAAVASVVIYSATLQISGGFKKEEINFFRSLLKI